MIFDQFGNPLPQAEPLEHDDDVVPHDPESDDITLEVETRPSTLDGISWWAVLKYKHYSWDELLPNNWGMLTEEARDERMAEVCARLKEQLRPIILAEDAKARLTLVK